MQIALIILSLFSKFLPAAINAWVQDRLNKNKPEIVENKTALDIQRERDEYNELLKKASQGDVKAQEEIRRRDAE